MKSVLALVLACLSHTLFAAEFKVADLTFTAPEGWNVVPSSSPMRAATLHTPVEGSDKPLETVFFYFGPGQGGDVEANVTRWFRQFDGKPETQREKIVVGDKEITLVQAEGTYLDGPPMAAKTPRPDYMLLGAIVPAADAYVFIRLTGPAKPSLAAKENFKALISSPFAPKP